MLGSGANGKKPIKEVEKLRARKAKLERVSSKLTKHKNADEKLYKAQADWDKTFDAISDWIALIDLKGRILRTNRSVEDFTGISSDQIVGQSCCKLVHGSEEHIPGCPLQKMLHTRQRKSAELKVPDANRWLIVTVDPVIGKEGNLIGAVHITRDVTERKKAELELKLHSEIMANMSEGVYLVSADDGIIAYANPKFEEIFGYDKGEMIGKHVSIVNAPTDKHPEGTAREIMEIINKEGAWEGEIENIKKDGTRFWCFASVTMFDHHEYGGVFVAVHTDIAERKKAEEAKHREELLSDSIVDNMPAGIAFLDNDFVLRRFNRTYAELIQTYTPYTGEQALGMSYFDYAVGSRPQVEEWFQKVRDTGQVDTRYGFKLVLKQDGLEKTTYWDTSVAPVLDIDGKVKGILILTQNVTERKKAEEALRKREELHELFFSQSLDGFFYMMFDEPIRWDDTVDKEKVLDYVFAHHRITKVNDAMLQQYGASQEQFIGLTPNDFYAHDIAYGRNVWRDFLDAGRLHLETDERKLDGTPIWIDGDYICLYDSQGRITGHFGIQREITEEKRAREALRESEQKYRALVKQSLQGIIILQDFQIVFANPTAAKIVGLTVEEVLALSPEDIKAFIPAEEQAAILQRYEERLADKPVEHNYELRLLRKNGDEFWLDVFVSRIEYLGKSAIQVAFIDITERKRAEEAYRSLVDHSLQGLAIFQNGRVVFANQAMADITGYTVEEMLTLPLEQVQAFVHPDVRELVWNRHRDRLNGEELPERYEFRGIRKDGSTCWLEIHASRIEYQGKPSIQAAYVDITERKRAEDNLRKSEEHYRMLAETMNEGLSQLDENGTFAYVNKKYCEILGYSPDEMIGRHWKDFFDESAQKIIKEQLTERKKGIAEPYEVINTRKDGQKIFLRMSPQPIFDEDGKFKGSFAIMTDVTEQKKAEEQIAKLAKFPAENPNPVLRISGHGTVIYANKASANLSKTWDCRVGKSLPEPWHEFVLDALSSGQSQQTEVQCDGRIFSLTLAPVVDANYVNVYGLDITERKKAEEKLLEDQAKLKAMASEMLLTEERERQRLAVGLHDSVCQKLVLTKLALETSLNLVSDSKVLASLRVACEGIGETIEQADSLTFELSNPVLRQLGFVIALEKYLTEEIQQKHGIEYELESDEQLSTLPDEIKNCLFRVTRELLTNVVKHAQACKVRVSVRKSQSQIYVRVQDDGVGFKESQASAKVSQTTRFGLFSIREQLEYLGGHLEIESEPGRGTTATVTVPLTKKAIV